MKEILYLIIYLSFVFSYSQKRIYELEKQIAIPFVEIYSDAGDLIDVTNEQGYINQNFEAKINSLSTRNVIFVHPFLKLNKFLLKNILIQKSLI